MVESGHDVVVIKLKDRTVTDFSTAIEAVMKMWSEIMNQDDPTTLAASLTK